MLAKYGLGIGLIVVMVAGFNYVYFSAPELSDYRLFSSAIKVFSKNAEPLEQEFSESKTIRPFNQSMDLKYINSDKIESSINLKMSSANNLVTLTFGQGESQLAEKTIIMEPYFSNKQLDVGSVRWKCIGGSVLLRYRTKACRLGYGIETKK